MAGFIPPTNNQQSSTDDIITSEVPVGGGGGGTLRLHCAELSVRGGEMGKKLIEEFLSNFKDLFSFFISYIIKPFFPPANGCTEMIS